MVEIFPITRKLFLQKLFFAEYSCCDPKLKNNWRCYNVDLSGDEFFGKFGRTCMDFTRSQVHCKNETSHKEQV